LVAAEDEPLGELDVVRGTVVVTVAVGRTGGALVG
jgi:hypothetical protein